jgi:hypothetical protein
MIIKMNKFGTTLLSRQAGREAWLAFQPQISMIGPKEKVEVNFEGVTTFSPSWADEFLTPLKKKFGDRVVLLETSNPSVEVTLEILELE